MSGISIYLEGGGDGAGGKAALRRGMDKFLEELKEAARRKSWNWKLVACGGRGSTFRAFRNANNQGDQTLVVLLVDSETAVQHSPRQHLSAQDAWNMRDIDADAVHLMVQTMETWLVADAASLAAYYNQGFLTNALPRAQDLEGVDKADIFSALQHASSNTQKGVYQKLRHGAELLAVVNSSLARNRCKRCERLFVVIGKAITGERATG